MTRKARIRNYWKGVREQQERRDADAAQQPARAAAQAPTLADQLSAEQRAALWATGVGCDLLAALRRNEDVMEMVHDYLAARADMGL